MLSKMFNVVVFVEIEFFRYVNHFIHACNLGRLFFDVAVDVVLSKIFNVTFVKIQGLMLVLLLLRLKV